ncbi:MAG: hypothetical protein U9N02_01315, partial [Campylobacterota bacterium]|nr:hypothetical protein [Campylobacterota bacterium]
FAIRPKSFNFSTNVNPLSTEYYAGENFTIDFNVSNVSQYNEAKDSSFEVIASVTNENCRIDGFEIKDFNFTDGVVNNVDANYSNIGDLNITIKEKDDCSDKFASVDCDDKDVLNHWNTDIDISIEAYSDQIYIKPYKLNVTVANMSASTGEDWLYMANVDDMNVSLFAEVKAFNKQGTVLKDFNSTCYDKEVKIDVKASFDTTGLDINYTTAVNDSFGSLDNVEDASSIDKTITIGDASFTDGEANVTCTFNVDRKYTTPISPFKVSDFNASVQDTSISKEVNWSKSSTQKIFYYGRVVADDIVTQKTPAEHFAEFEVYDADSSSYVTDFKQNSLRWYRNKNHTDLKDGNITIVNDISVNNFHINNNGKIDFNISNTIPNTYNMHIETQEWLFYNPYATNFDTTSLNCMEHPCFKYTFKGSPSTLTGIKSGDFNGTSYEIKPRGKYERTGVKVFR